MSNRFILLVEDNPDDEALTLRAFKKLDLPLEVVVSRDGPEALDFLFGRGSYSDRDTSVQPELILLDLKLPKLDGLEVLRRIREDSRTHLNPVVVLTSSAEDRDIVRSYELGTNSYLRKPVDFSRFFETVRQIGSYWLELNVSPIGRA